jgi:hypothetical protein
VHSRRGGGVQVAGGRSANGADESAGIHASRLFVVDVHDPKTAAARSRVRREFVPQFVIQQHRAFIIGQVLCEQGQSFAQQCCSRRDQSVVVGSAPRWRRGGIRRQRGVKRTRAIRLAYRPMLIPSLPRAVR